MSPDLVVFATSSVPEGLRGAMTKWCLEVLPGVFIGRLNARVRDGLWEALVTGLKGETGETVYAARVRSADTEQGYAIDTYGTHPLYHVEDHHGLALIVKARAAEGDEPWDPLDDLPHPSW